MSNSLQIKKYNYCDTINISHEGKKFTIIDIQSSKNGDILTEYVVPKDHNQTIMIIPYTLDDTGMISKIGVIPSFFPNRISSKSYTAYTQEMGMYDDEYSYCKGIFNNKFNTSSFDDNDWTYITRMYSSENYLQEYSLWSVNCTFHLEELCNSSSPFEFFTIGQLSTIGDILIASSYFYIWKNFYDNYLLKKNEITV